jgi:hypothetical protein
VVLSTGELVSAWAQHVSRLIEESVAADPMTAWGVDDYVATLFIRDFLADALEDSEAAAAQALAAAVAPTDEAFRQFTQPDPERSVWRATRFEEGTGWWWRRIPRHGPVLEELRASRPTET